MASMWFLTVFGQAAKQNKKMQWLEGFCLLKKKEKRHKCFRSSAPTNVVVFFPLKTFYIYLYSRKIPFGFVLMPCPALLQSPNLFVALRSYLSPRNTTQSFKNRDDHSIETTIHLPVYVYYPLECISKCNTLQLLV